MNFCVVILILKKKQHFWHFMLYYLKKGNALEKEMATHSSVLAWRIPGTGEPGGLSTLGSHRVGHDWSDLAAAAAAMQMKCKKDLCSVWRGCCGWKYQNGCQNFMLEISCWTILHDQIDQLKLVAIRDINWEQSVLYHVEDSRHTQNIQIKNWKSFAPGWLCYLLWYLGST